MSAPPTAGVVLAGAPADRAGTASAVFNVFRQIGAAVAIVVFGALIANPDSFITGMRISLASAAGLLILAALSSLRIQPQRA